MNRSRQSALDDFNTGALVSAALLGQTIEAVCELEQCAAATSNNSLFDGSTGGVEGILDPQLAVVQFGLRRRADLDDGHTTSELGDALVQLLAVVVGFCGIQLPLDCGHPVSDGGTVVVGGDDGGGFLADGDPPRFAEVLEADGIQAHGLVFADQRAAGEDGDVRKGSLAALPERRSPDGGDLKNTAALVHHQGGEGLTLDFFGQDQQRRATALHRFQHRNQVGHGADLAVGQQDQRIVELADLTVSIRDEVGGAVTPVEGHAFRHLEFRGQ